MRSDRLPAAHSISSKDHALWAAGMVFIVPLCFVCFTNHVWEDYFITFRASKNLAEGNGLVFQIGERVHSFTSPLGVLIPALTYYATHSVEATIWIFRILSCVALAGANYLIWNLLQEENASLEARWFVSLALISESKVVDFATNGMECAFMIFFAALLLRLLLKCARAAPLQVGFALAGLMWTRPDAFVVALAVMASALAFNFRRWTDWAPAAKFFAKASLWAALIYGPWLSWAWWYYGSPIPQTIIAKSGRLSGHTSASFLVTAPIKFLIGASSMARLATPSYFLLGGWPDVIITIGHGLAIVAGFVWLWPKAPVWVRTSSLGLLLGSYYLQLIPPAPWYFPVWYLFAAIALGGASATCLERFSQAPITRSVIRCLVLALFLVQVATVGLTAIQFKAQQTLIENNGRRSIGQWLAANGKSTDTVFLEPLGYIGYFSGMHMLDYPGLCAPSVVSATREVGPNFSAIIAKLKPTWVILRPSEIRENAFDQSTFLQAYEPVKSWDAREKIESIPLLPGRGVLDFDAVFLLYRRRHL